MCLYFRIEVTSTMKMTTQKTIISIFPAVKTSNLIPPVFFTYSYFYCLYFRSSHLMESLLDSLYLLAMPFHVTVIVSDSYPRMCFTCTMFISSFVTPIYADNNCAS
jgi:hypothetical protein